MNQNPVTLFNPTTLVTIYLDGKPQTMSCQELSQLLTSDQCLEIIGERDWFNSLTPSEVEKIEAEGKIKFTDYLSENSLLITNTAHYAIATRFPQEYARLEQERMCTNWDGDASHNQ